LIPWRELPYHLERFEDVYDDAIIRAMVDLGYKHLNRGTSICLTASYMQERLEWARAYENFTPENWFEICFSDEIWATGVSVYRE